MSTSAQAPLFFARALGIDSATVHARAVARVAGASTVDGSGIDSNHTGEPIPLVLPVSGVPDGSGFGRPTSITWGAGYQLGHGQFGILDFSNGKENNAPKDIANWITNGYPGSLGVGSYPGVNGNKTMASAVDDAMTSLVASHPTILLPVYTTSGSTFQIVGWAAFKAESWVKGSGTSTLNGEFTRLDVAISGPTAQYFGAEPEPSPPAGQVSVKAPPPTLPRLDRLPTIDELERLVAAAEARGREGAQQWRWTVYYLRSFSDADGRLPRMFEPLVAPLYSDAT